MIRSRTASWSWWWLASNCFRRRRRRISGARPLRRPTITVSRELSTSKVGCRRPSPLLYSAHTDVSRLSKDEHKRRFSRALLSWYDRHKRNLPWREENPDPYRVWVSEIMLQQTRVAVVVGYFERFIRRFPTIEDLALATEHDVLTMWSGLGYYRRARLLHKAARAVVAEHGGVLPGDSQSLRTLPGIGRYTANAIASIVFGEPVAVVDGNVERVLNRVYGRALPTSQHWHVAQRLVPAKRPGKFNQAMMELGATVCTPVSPLCGECPVKAFCSAKRPLRRDTREQRLRKRLSYALDQRNGLVKLVKRAATERLMPSMFELPASQPGIEAEFRLKHSITNTDYEIAVSRTRSRNGTYVPASDLHQLPLTGLTRKILRRAGLMS